MAQAPYGLDQARREVVLQAIQEICRHRNWDLLAAHVRTNHVHVVVGAEVPPEKVMGDSKHMPAGGLTRCRSISLTARDGAPWEHAMARETRERIGGYRVCRCG